MAVSALSVGVPLAGAASARSHAQNFHGRIQLGHTLAPNTRFYVPPPADGSRQQIHQLLRSGQFDNARLIAAMESVPQAVWLDGETSAQTAEGDPAGSQAADRSVFRQVRETLHRARWQHAVPTFVAYNIPGRDCSQFSAGGAPNDADYASWISSISRALGDAKAIVLLEPDGLANLPGYCGATYNTEFPQITNTTRIDDIANAVPVLEQDPNISLYLDAGHSAWQGVGTIADTLTAADVQQAQGFFLDVSNYQYTTNNEHYGIWVSSCITSALANGATQSGSLSEVAPFTSANHNPSPTGSLFGNPCGPSEYYNGGPSNNFANDGNWGGGGAGTGSGISPFGQWSDNTMTPNLDVSGPDSQYKTPAVHFVIDTSRNGLGPNEMTSYMGTPFNQPASIAGDGGSLQSGNWCNPPGRGLGALPTANTAGMLNAVDSFLPANTPNVLDALLWVKTPGQSDGQCDLAGGVRNWDNTADTPSIAGWPASTDAAFQTFDPLWSLQAGSVVTDPAAGAWFPAQALQLARNANPALP